MKILYVSDNRCRGNFGCRATSTALSQLIGEKFEIVGHISGAYTNWSPGNLVFNKHWSEKKYIRKANGKYWRYTSQLYFMAHRFMDKHNFFLGKHDFISYDLDKSIENLIKCIPANPHLKEFDLRQYDFDSIVVNGEGSFIFATPAWRESMILTMLMHWAQKLGKKVYFLNAMFSDDPNSEHNVETINLVSSVLEKCEVVQVREKYSFDYAKQYFPSIKNLQLRPDALFSWFNLINDNFRIGDGKYFIPFGSETDESYSVFNYSKPYILLCGSSSSLISKNLKETVNVYSKLALKIKESFPNHNVYLIQSCDGDEFLKEVSSKTNIPMIPMETNIIIIGKIISNCDVFFTGRYHPAILGSLGGTPCVFMSSNSHKTKSLQELLEYDILKEFSCMPSEEEMEEIIHLGKKYLSDLRIREKIKHRAKYLFDEARTIQDLVR